MRGGGEREGGGEGILGKALAAGVERCVSKREKQRERERE